MLNIDDKSQDSNEIWRKKFQEDLIQADRKRMIEASSRKYPKYLRQTLLDQKLRAAETFVIESVIPTARQQLIVDYNHIKNNQCEHDSDCRLCNRIFNQNQRYNHV